MIAAGKMRENTFSTGDGKKFLDWLQENPITNAMDIDFIHEEVESLLDLILQAKQAATEKRDSSSSLVS